jgi:hypothetical protein
MVSHDTVIGGYETVTEQLITTRCNVNLQENDGFTHFAAGKDTSPSRRRPLLLAVWKTTPRI